MKIDVEIVGKGNATGAVIDDAISSSAVVPFPCPVKLDTIVAKVVAATATKVDRVVSLVNGETVVEDAVVVLNRVGAIVVVRNVDIIVRIVAVVVFIGASVAMNGNLGHGLIIGGPSIESNT